MACGYCDVGGYAKDSEHNLPGWHLLDLHEIEAFVDQEVADGHVIYLTGGEPLMFPELVRHLGLRVRERGGYVVVCTNASAKHRLIKSSAFVDEFSISLKGTPRTAEKISGVSGRLAFDLPYKNTASLLASGPCKVELVVVLFDSVSYDEFCGIYAPFFGKAHLTLKEYRPKVTTVDDDHSYKTVISPNLFTEGARPMSAEAARALYRRLVEEQPEIRGMISLVLGGGGDQTVLDDAGERLFTR